MLMSKMYWKWLSSLYHSTSKQVIDPYTWRCKCGYSWKFSKLQLLWMFIHNDYTHTCPQCFRQSRYRMITHVVRETDTEKIRMNNRLVE